MSKEHDVLKSLLGGTHHIAEWTKTQDSPTYGPNQEYFGIKGQSLKGHYNPNNGYYRGFDGYEWTNKNGKSKGSSSK